MTARWPMQSIGRVDIFALDEEDREVLGAHRFKRLLWAAFSKVCTRFISAIRSANDRYGRSRIGNGHGDGKTEFLRNPRRT